MHVLVIQMYLIIVAFVNVNYVFWDPMPEKLYEKG